MKKSNNFTYKREKYKDYSKGINREEVYDRIKFFLKILIYKYKPIYIYKRSRRYFKNLYCIFL